VCIADVRLGRAKSRGRASSITGTPGTPVLLVGANANRAALIVGVDPSGFASAAEFALIYDDRTSGAAVAFLNQYRPSIVLDVETYGGLMTGPVWVFDGSAAGLGIYYTEIVWTADPEAV